MKKVSILLSWKQGMNQAGTMGIALNDLKC